MKAAVFRAVNTPMQVEEIEIDKPGLVEFYLQGRLHLDEMISNRIGLADLTDALQALDKGEVARSVVVFDA